MPSAVRHTHARTRTHSRALCRFSELSSIEELKRLRRHAAALEQQLERHERHSLKARQMVRPPYCRYCGARRRTQITHSPQALAHGLSADDPEGAAADVAGTMSYIKSVHERVLLQPPPIGLTKSDLNFL
jgi:hypothetical protein